MITFWSIVRKESVLLASLTYTLVRRRVDKAADAKYTLVDCIVVCGVVGTWPEGDLGRLMDITLHYSGRAESIAFVNYP